MSVNIVLVLLGVLVPMLETAGIIPANYKNLADGILGAITAFKNEITNNQGKVTATATTMFIGINAGVQALAAAGALGGASGIAVALSNAAAKGLAAESSLTSLDPSQLKPIEPPPAS